MVDGVRRLNVGLNGRTVRSQHRTMIRFEFEFSQEGGPVYFGDQTETFLKYPYAGE